jgi:glyoxylase-like metal-dependent hydrolase (beta-lactamase superfamily II)
VSQPLEVRTLAVGPFQANCFLVRATSGGSVVVIDPGAEPERIEAGLEEWGADPSAILLTHAHVDHVGGVGQLVQRYDAPVYLHKDDLPMYTNAAEHGAMFGLRLEMPPPPEVFFEHGGRVAFGDLSFEVRHAPGHSPGGVVLCGGSEAFVGDCVFAGSIGRTDLPGGDAATLLHSIQKQILTLPATTVLYTGHGPATTVQREAESNPFLTGHPGWWVG